MRRPTAGNGGHILPPLLRMPVYPASAVERREAQGRTAGLANLSLSGSRASGWVSQAHPRRRAGGADRKVSP
jgi:hypothetical protein